VIAAGVARPGWLSFVSQRGRPELLELIAALANEPIRPVEGRLTGGFKYAPPSSPTRGATDHPVSPVVRIAAAKVERAVTADESPQGKAALGVASLLLGDVDRSIDLLESAASSGNVAPFLSDLAAAYIARGIRRDQRSDLQRALSLAERAIRIDQSLREAYFNYALALQALGDSRAASAWAEYQQRDPQGSWHDEASRYMRPVR
jgi:tetratricopeptide (TPR) repeat protein